MASIESNNNSRRIGKSSFNRLTTNAALTSVAALLLLVTPDSHVVLADEKNSLPGIDRSQQRRNHSKQEDHGPPRPDAHPALSPSLDGYGNNRRNPSQGASGALYRRLSAAHYADGVSAMIEGPDLRYISNRIFADGTQNLFSENSVTQWAYNWGQFIDHTIGLRQSGTEEVEVPFDENDPLEFFSNSSENLRITRSAKAADSGIDSPRQQVNTVSSYIDAWAVYGGTDERLEWLRDGQVDGDLSNNSARLLLTESGHLPPASFRGDAASAPAMERMGMLRGIADADDVVVIAGDTRANENIALTAVQTLFAREHNRIVGLLPQDLTEQEKFAMARRLVIATQQYITYNEFLPALGLYLTDPGGYNPKVDATVSHEFATVGYRAHSMIHGEIEMEVAADRYAQNQLEEFREAGIEVEQTGDELELAVPLNIAFANPQLAVSLGIGSIASGLGGEPQYKNDETIDNQLRSVLFQIPNPDIANPDACLDGPSLPECFLLVSDVGVLDVFRARDHGVANYNTLREAYGLQRIESFAELTGEATEEFPTDDPQIDVANPIDDPGIMEFVELRDLDGKLLEPGSAEADAETVTGMRRTTLAARLKAIYGDVEQVDAFVGMVSEPHLIGSEFGELQYAMWKTQFEALRDGDSNFYLWSRPLRKTMQRLRGMNIDYKQTLADIIINNTDVEASDIQENVFLIGEE